MLNLNLQPLPALFTQRLVLRPLSIADAPEILFLRSHPEVNRYIGRPACTGIAEAEAHINKISTNVKAGQSAYWAITLKEVNNLIGTICLWNFDALTQSVELGYELMPAQQRKGLMAEAVACVIQYGFEQVNAQTITAFVSADNEPSLALLRQFNFKPCDELFNDPQLAADNMLVFSLKKQTAV